MRFIQSALDKVYRKQPGPQVAFAPLRAGASKMGLSIWENLAYTRDFMRDYSLGGVPP